jgi:hypothetical protein
MKKIMMTALALATMIGMTSTGAMAVETNAKPEGMTIQAAPSATVTPTRTEATAVPAEPAIIAPTEAVATTTQSVSFFSTVSVKLVTYYDTVVDTVVDYFSAR